MWAAVELELQKQAIKNKQQEDKQTEVNEKISNLIAKMEEMEAKIISQGAKIISQGAKINSQEAKILSQEEKRVKELADKRDEFDAMIAAQKLQMDEKHANQTQELEGKHFAFLDRINDLG